MELSVEQELPGMPDKPYLAKLIDKREEITNSKNVLLEERRKLDIEIIAALRKEKRARLERGGFCLRIIGNERIIITKIRTTEI